MNKGTRWIKRVMALSLVLLLSIESFGAIVSDNDGSAFITKAEFDSLKNDFQAQIDTYNTSIDNKIDGAIAAYLAGIKISQETTEDVLYFATFSENEKSVYMIKNNSNKSSYGYGHRKMNWGFSSLYTANYSVTANISAVANGDGNKKDAKRRFVSYDRANKLYRWQGYTENYYEKLTITGFVNAHNADTGFSDGTVWMYAPYTSSYSRTGFKTNATDGWKVGVGDTNIISPYRDATSVAVSWEANSYELKRTKDLVYSDFAANKNWYDEVAQWYVDGNPDNNWWAGSDIYYTQNDYSVTGLARNEINNQGPQNRTVGNSLKTNKTGPGSYYWISTCPSPNIKLWNTIKANDATKYYDERTDTYIQDYGICEGMPVISSEKNKEYTWPVKFNGSTTLYLKYGKFGSTETTPSSPIKLQLSVDGGKTWTTKSDSVTLTEGIIKFETDSRGGLIFCKWNNERCMYKDGSSSIKSKDKE